ncbi:MAG: branched-chain amino acid ABC transporter permease [Clostridia bacterium]|nr:branched-chain amino acid ABC transporter permease [Clostridia bacterium]
MSLLSTLLNGLSLGSVYAIIALGYTMVYGIAKMLNFAHGDVIMIGAYITYSAIAYWKLPPLLGFLLAMVVSTVLGVVIESLAYKPLRQATSLAVLITAIGISYLLQNGAQLIWGATPKVFPTMFSLPNASLFGGSVTISNNTISLLEGRLMISGNMLVTILACVIIMVCLSLFINKTKMGKAMRCVSEDKGAAELMGVNVNLTISLTFAIGSALAAVAGVLQCTSYSTFQHTMGAMPGIKAFTAAVFGGIGSIPGAMVGGILLGIIEMLGKTFVSDQLGDAFAFAVLIIVLLVKPTGLLGKKVHEKV